MPKLPKWVTRFHRTRTDYTPAIDKQGLKAKSPNMGENTHVYDVKDLENVWLADNRYNIPVLRRYGASPDITTYKVRIPYNKYWYEMKRNTMPKGRGSGKFKPVKPGQPSMFSEGNYQVDLIGEDIPPQYLQKLPIYLNERGTTADDVYDILINGPEEFVEDNISRNVRDLPRRLRGEAVRYVDTYLNTPHNKPVPLPSEELIRALLPDDIQYKAANFVKTHRDNLSRTKSPAHALTATLDKFVDIPSVYNTPLSWNIYEPTKYVYTKNVPIHQGAISRGERSPLNDDTRDWEPQYTLRKRTKPLLHDILNNVDNGEDPAVRKLDSLYLLPGIHAIQMSNGGLTAPLDRILERVPENRELFYKLLDANDAAIKRDWDAKGIKYNPKDVSQWRNAKYFNWFEQGVPTYSKNLLQTLPEPNWSELDNISDQLLKIK